MGLAVGLSQTDLEFVFGRMEGGSFSFGLSRGSIGQHWIVHPLLERLYFEPQKGIVAAGFSLKSTRYAWRRSGADQERKTAVGRCGGIDLTPFALM